MEDATLGGVSPAYSAETFSLSQVMCSCCSRNALPEMVLPRWCCFSVKVTGLVQKLVQLEAVSRDLQSKSWANLNLLGQPCNFYAFDQAWRWRKA